MYENLSTGPVSPVSFSPPPYVFPKFIVLRQHFGPNSIYGIFALIPSTFKYGPLYVAVEPSPEPPKKDVIGIFGPAYISLNPQGIPLL